MSVFCSSANTKKTFSVVLVTAYSKDEPPPIHSLSYRQTFQKITPEGPQTRDVIPALALPPGHGVPAAPIAPRSLTLSAVLGAGFSFPLAINIALIFAATAAAASSAPDGAAELSEPAAAGPPSPPPGKGRPGSGAVPGRRNAGAGPGWSHLLRRLENGQASVPAGRGLPGAPAPEPPGPAAAAPGNRRTEAPARGPPAPADPASPAGGPSVALPGPSRRHGSDPAPPPPREPQRHFRPPSNPGRPLPGVAMATEATPALPPLQHLLPRNPGARRAERAQPGKEGRRGRGTAAGKGRAANRALPRGSQCAVLTVVPHFS